MQKSYLGIELGSTRIKAVAVDSKTMAPICTGDYFWKSDFVDGIWTYDLARAWEGLAAALSKVQNLENVEAVGISGMMHGYLAFDENWQLLTPFRTWQNTITAQSAAELTELFGFNVPQRWCSAHLYQAILNEEDHVGRVAHITTLASYIHYMLTGENVVGIGEASGMFPIDSKTGNYDQTMLEKFNERLAAHGFTRSAQEVLPKVLTAGQSGGKLTAEGAKRLNGLLPEGIPFAPPEGDAGTGMVATNSVAEKTGNISAGTSIFAMVVLKDRLSKLYEEIDMVTTPDGKPVAMVHCNNCTNDINEWVSLFRQVLALFGKTVSDNELYTKLYECSLQAAGDCDGVLVCNSLSGEVITGFEKGMPLLLRSPNSDFSIGNLMRSQIYSTMATLHLGAEIFKEEGVEISRLTGHGGLFKTKNVAQRYMAAAMHADVVCLDSSGEGGPYGMALLAAYMHRRNEFATLDEFLDCCAFAEAKACVISPSEGDIADFASYMADYKKLLKVEKTAVAELAN